MLESNSPGHEMETISYQTSNWYFKGSPGDNNMATTWIGQVIYATFEHKNSCNLLMSESFWIIPDISSLFKSVTKYKR